MTLSTTASKKQYSGDGSTTAFPTTWPLFANSTVQATLRDALGVDTVWTEGVEYTLTGGGGATGTLTATTAPATGETLTLNRVETLDQEVDYPEGGAFPSQTHENVADKLTMIDQQQDEEISRAFKAPSTDPATALGDIPSSVDRASKFAAYDSAGKPIASTGPTGDSSIPVSAFMETVLDDITAAAARTTLAAAGLADANAFTGVNTFSESVRWSKGADIASASPLVLGTDGNYFDVTGTTGFSTVTVAAGTLFMLQFDGALTMTDGASLDLGGANITTAAGDRGMFFSTAANTVQLLAYQAEGFKPWPLAVATQAEMETATAVDRIVPPGRAHNHPGVAKFRCTYDGSLAGPITPDEDYNVDDITDTGTGLQVINITTDFATADYTPFVLAKSTGVNAPVWGSISDTSVPTVGALAIELHNDTGTLTDSGIVCVGAFGDQ